MKKQIFSAAVALAAVAALSVNALAIDAGFSNGSGTGTQTITEDTPVSITPEGITDVKIEAAAGVFGAGDLTINVSVEPVEAAAATTVAASIESAVAEATVSAVNTKIDIEALLDGVVVEPNGTVTITVAYDGVSNMVAHFKDDGTVEMLALTVSGNVASFNTTSFSDFYMVTATVNTVSGGDTNGDTNTTTPDKNQATGVALAVIPAIVAASAIVVSKKRK